MGASTIPSDGCTIARDSIQLRSGTSKHAAAKRPTATGKYHLAMAYLKMGDRRRGTEALNQALKMDPKLPEAAMARQVLAETAQKSANR